MIFTHSIQLENSQIFSISLDNKEILIILVVSSPVKKSSGLEYIFQHFYLESNLRGTEIKMLSYVSAVHSWLHVSMKSFTVSVNLIFLSKLLPILKVLWKAKYQNIFFSGYRHGRERIPCKGNLLYNVLSCVYSSIFK